jgi:hypothetical protein
MSVTLGETNHGSRNLSESFSKLVRNGKEAETVLILKLMPGSRRYCRH